MQTGKNAQRKIKFKIIRSVQFSKLINIHLLNRLYIFRIYVNVKSIQ